eukprot:TRINITY_DN3214_c0_g1_i1.p1 TRINITY_DN3214_c0_g1~~TRINITY_DN3214_c0_g1_i1.p1  ORF type:complete len:542 (+),score=70.25 TRINITY_DN3214_c0_g1_i1:83-1708(+)
MQASKVYRSSERSHGLYYNHNGFPLQEVESYFFPQNSQNLDQIFVDNAWKSGNFPLPTLESSLGTGGCKVYNASSNLSFLPSGAIQISQHDCRSYLSDPHYLHADTYGSPASCSCLTDDVNDLKHKLRELETVMLGPDSDTIVNSFAGTFQGQLLDLEKWKQVMDISNGDVKQVLIACARAIADHDKLTAEWLMAELRKLVSVSGEPIQRLGAYMLEGLVARLASSGGRMSKSLRCKEPASSELLSYMHVLYEVCPYFKFGYMSANGAIAEALKDEDRVHIIDFQIAQGSQWPTLIQALSTRPGGPPHIRITGIDDSISTYARGGGLRIVGLRLSRLAESCNVPFEFHAAAVPGCEIEAIHLGVRPGEAVAVNFAFQLHHMPDESVSTVNHRDRLLRLVKGLSPKVVTLVEHESNTNTAPFVPRFIEALNYYNAIFESIDATLSRENKLRINVEQHCLAREIVNIIACEGPERVERHEAIGKWRSRFKMAGFSPYPLSSFVNSTIKTLLENYCQNFMLEERDGVLYLGWMNKALVVSCAWQ